MRSNGNLQSAPEDADVVDIQLERGDTILLATDGLYDNLYDHVCCMYTARYLVHRE